MPAPRGPDEKDTKGQGRVSSNPDSFIDEVTEAVRRDRLFTLMRRYGWIGVLIIVLIVGYSAWVEYSAAREEARAQRFGTAVIDATDMTDPDKRAAALAEVQPETPDQQAILTLVSSTTADDAPALLALSQNTEVPQVYRDLAAFRRLLLADLPADQRRAGFEQLTSPGAPLRVLAVEQLALLDIDAGNTGDAIDRLKTLTEDEEASGALRRRAQQLIVALGGSSDGAAGAAPTGAGTNGTSGE